MSDAMRDPKQIFLEALDRESPEELLRYLDEACGDNAEVRSRVEALLRAHGEVGNFLGGPPSETPTIDQPLTEQPGTLIGPYKLLQKLGEGGMGVVYLAEQKDPVDRRVAVKIIKPGMDTRQVIARFEAERQALAMMDHPNIAHVLDAGATESGRPFFAMELVKGIPITQYCDQTRLTVHQRLDLFMQVCHAVQHAHQKGVIHRDLKPSNVLVAEYDDLAVPKIIDFGVAKATQTRLTEKTMFTQIGQIVGTLEYMSPEQAKLNQLDIDTRSDVYSMGVLLYELLAGETPFDQQRLRAAAFNEMLRILREEEPLRPSLKLSSSQSLPSIAANRHIEPQKLGTVIRGDLDWIVMKALEKDRRRRYESANGLAADIGRFLRDEPVEACPPSIGYKFHKLWRRNRAALSVAGVIVAILVLGVVATSWQAMRADYEANRANLAAEHERQQRNAADKNREQAEKQRDRARETTEANRRLLYLSDMNVLQQGWDKVHLTHALDLLNRHWPEPGQRDLRGFEWWHHWRRWHRGAAIQTLKHENDVSCLAFSPDDETVAISDGNNVKLWDAETHEVRDCFVGHADEIVTVAFSPDGRLLASGSRDKTVRVWEVATGEGLWTLAASARTVAFLPDGNTLAAGISPSSVKLWDVATGAERKHLGGIGYVGNQMVFSPDGKTLAGTGSRTEVAIWDLGSGEHFSLSGHTAWPKCLAFSPDGVVLATSGNDGRILLWDVASKQRLPTQLLGHTAPVYSVAFAPDGNTLASSSCDSTVRLWDVTTAQATILPPGHALSVRCLVFSSDGKTLASLGDDRSVKLWDVATLTPPDPITLRGHETGIVGIAFSPDGETLATVANDEQKVRIWNIKSGQQARPPFAYAHRPQCVAFSTDGKVLAVNDADGSVELREVKSDEVLHTFAGHHGTVMAVAFSPDGKTLATSSTDQTVLLRNVKTGERLSEFQVGAGYWRGLAFSPDSRMMATSSSSDSTVRIWDVGTGAEKHSLSGHTRGVFDVAFSPDGTTLASGSADMTVRLWDVVSGAETHTFFGHTAKISSLTFAPDGRTLASGSWDGTVKLWNLIINAEAATLPGHVGDTHVAFSPDGTTLATTGLDATIKLWRRASDDEVQATSAFR